MNTSSHISLEILADAAENRVSGTALQTAMAHVSGCSECNDTLRRLQHLIDMMRTDTADDAPPDLLRSAIDSFSPERQAPVRRIIAVLTFDSRNAGSALGLRSIRIASRQLLYSAHDTDLDLRISVQNEECVVTGQIIRESCVEGRVEISGVTGSASATLNELCEFTLPPLPVGNYSLKVRMPGVEIEIPELDLKD
ncbi:MAG TPA: hypothetical protein VK893_14525 [Pyrinomonadaceae bacterium]|nr:hypothetical protein [Pyrinomonadaceae bacterium]